MSEYIIHYKDAETLYGHTDFPFLLEEYLREEIVRCRDCAYVLNREYNGGIKYQTCSYFDSEYAEVDLDGFCAWGERKAVEE